MIPGWLISLFTFPGIIIHEWSHKKYCEWFKIPIYKVVYFRLGNPAGYVLHKEPDTYKQIFWISVGPLIINSLLTIFLSFLAFQAKEESFLWYILFWIAGSIGMHSFPSDDDVKHILNASKKELKTGGSQFHYLAYPFVGLIFLANILRIVWFDLFYSIGLIFIGGILAGYY